jgi:hypothetical protein
VNLKWPWRLSRTISPDSIRSKLATQMDSTGKVSNDVELDFLQVVEKMERETGIEPATNSLEG